MRDTSLLRLDRRPFYAKLTQSDGNTETRPSLNRAHSLDMDIHTLLHTLRGTWIHYDSRRFYQLSRAASWT
jgi:hypothetical protein